MNWLVEMPGGTTLGPFSEAEALDYVVKQIPGSEFIARRANRDEQRALTPRDPAKIRAADPDHVPLVRADDIEAFAAQQARKRGDPDIDAALYKARAVLRKCAEANAGLVATPRHELKLVLDHLDAMDGVDDE